MTTIKTVTAAVTAALAVALNADLASAAIGNVIFYQHIEFGGEPKNIDNIDEGKCYDIGCFGKKASSAKWNLAHTSSGGRLTKITFYADMACRGAARTWDTNAPNQPSNFVLDGFNDQVQSFVVWDDRYIITAMANGCTSRALREQAAGGANLTMSAN